MQVNAINVIITGATGMVGKGVLLECLDSDKVNSVLCINRSPLGMVHGKLKELIVEDFFDLESVKPHLTGYGACFFCLGVSSVGLPREQYERITYDLTLYLAKTALEVNPRLIFCYVSGAGTDSTESKGAHWARIKGKTENALMNMQFGRSYMFRPGFIEPKRGIRSKTRLYQTLITIFRPLFPIIRLLAPRAVTTTIKLGKAMINTATTGAEKQILEPADINALAKLHEK